MSRRRLARCADRRVDGTERVLLLLRWSAGLLLRRARRGHERRGLRGGRPEVRLHLRHHLSRFLVRGLALLLLLQDRVRPADGGERIGVGEVVLQLSLQVELDHVRHRVPRPLSHLGLQADLVAGQLRGITGVRHVIGQLHDVRTHGVTRRAFPGVPGLGRGLPDLLGEVEELLAVGVVDAADVVHCGRVEVLLDEPRQFRVPVGEVVRVPQPTRFFAQFLIDRKRRGLLLPVLRGLLRGLCLRKRIGQRIADKRYVSQPGVLLTPLFVRGMLVVGDVFGSPTRWRLHNSPSKPFSFSPSILRFRERCSVFRELRFDQLPDLLGEQTGRVGVHVVRGRVQRNRGRPTDRE